LPSNARKVAILNQADSAELKGLAQGIAASIRTSYDAVLVATAQEDIVHAVFEPTAGIVLAAGGASRFGRPKQLLDWHGEPLVRASARAALEAGLDPVLVVTGSHFGEVEAAVAGLPVVLARNPDWEQGQSSSIRVGLAACPPPTGSAVFLLADQPFITPGLIRALVDAHASESAGIVAPLIREDRRGNPVLFDREMFTDLRALEGDSGGRALFGQHRVRYVDWHDDRILRDIDTEEDYRRLQSEDQS
jgi:molybdenum cofactor cytidylyltransferase